MKIYKQTLLGLHGYTHDTPKDFEYDITITNMNSNKTTISLGCSFQTLIGWLQYAFGKNNRNPLGSMNWLTLRLATPRYYDWEVVVESFPSFYYTQNVLGINKAIFHITPISTLAGDCSDYGIDIEIIPL